MTWLREMCRALFDALLEHWRAPRRTRMLGGDAALDRKVADHIRLRRRQQDQYGNRRGQR